MATTLGAYYDEDDENFGAWRRTINKFSKIHRLAMKKVQDAEEDDDEGMGEGSSSASASASESEASDDEDAFPMGGAYQFGLRHWSPRLYNWIQARIGNRSKVSLILFMMVLQAWLFAMQEEMYAEVSVISIIVVINATSLSLSLFCSFFLEGGSALDKILDWHVAWRFIGISAMFVIGSQCEGLAFKYGLSSVYRNTLGYLYLPISAIISYTIFKRDYGQLEWLSLMMLVLAIATFILLRERCRLGNCSDLFETKSGIMDVRVLLVLASVMASVIASIFAERIYKERSKRLIEIHGGTRHDHYYIMKVHLDFAGLLISTAIWVFPTWYIKTFTRVGGSVYWFGNWNRYTVIFVFVSVGQWWMAGLITKRFSTVVKSIVQSVSVSIAILFKDPWMNKYHFEERWIPSVCMVCIIILAALIFQTGRINLKTIRRSLGQERRPAVLDLSLGHQLALLHDKLHDARDWAHARRGRKQTAGEFQMVPTTDGEEDSAPRSSPSSPLLTILRGYAVIIAYILADAARTEIQTIAMGKSMITPQSMAVMSNLASLILFNFMVYSSPREGRTGWEELVLAYNFGKIAKFLVSGMFFALTSALMSMGMGLGISGALSVVIGKIYLPIAAFFSRYVLDKFYLWLEWFAIVILTLDSMAFGFLQSMGSGGRATSPIAVLCIAGAAISAALNSLIMELLMKTETDPFLIQKIRLDFGAVLFSILFLPVMGYISDPKGFPQGAFWRYRPLTKECTWTGHCEDSTFVYVNGTFSTTDGTSFCVTNSAFCNCECGKGVFVCWDDLKLFMFLGISVLHSVIVGMVVKRFSSVYRAVADNFSLMLIYFIADPLLGRGNTNDKSLNMTALILPLSSQIFSQASAELKAFKEAQEREASSSNNSAERKERQEDSDG